MSEELVGLIPAAGKGLRLGLPYPKELYPIIRDNRYKPVSQFVLENLTCSGVRHIIFVINETKHQLIGFYGNGSRFGCQISYVVQESDDDGQGTSPGLGHALDSAYHLVRGKTVCFGMADTIMTPQDIFAHIWAAATPDDDVLLGLFPTDRPYKLGMVNYDADDRVIEIIDKPKQTHLEYAWGCIIWRPRFTEHLHVCIHKRGIADFASIMNLAIGEGMRFRSVRVNGATYADLGTYEEIVELENRYRAR